jgi:four helix bundle protein
MNYFELDVWKRCRSLVKDVYALTQAFPREESFGLTAQLRRCAVSVPSNVAEGCGRNSAKDTLQFLYVARGSLYELETQLCLAFDLSYIAEEKLNVFLAEVTECKKLLNGFINYYQRLAS